jgi:NADPH2:quinone reductase
MKIRLIRSAVIEAPIERVWAVLRDFNSHERWHPAVTRSQMENDFDGDVVGGVRRFSLTDGAELREQLLHHSDRDTTITYSILDSPLPLLDYVATVRLKPVTDGNHTFWDWRVRFRAPADRAAALETLVGRQICEAGFTGLRRFLDEQTAPPTAPSGKTDTAVLAAAAAGEPLPARAVVVTIPGGPEVMSLHDVTVSAPTGRQVRIRQTAIAVNTLDLHHRRGIAAGVDLPGTPGLEGVGEIIDVGEQANGLFRGDRVAYMSRTAGAYADICCVDADACIPLPDGVSDSEAATLLKGVTAGLLLSRVFRAVRGAVVLIEAVSGGMGHLLSQWAHSMDLTVIGTVSTVDNARFSRDHGCGHPIVVSDGKPLAEEVMRITNGRGVDYWVHSGAHGLDDAIDGLARCGHCAIIDHHGEQPLRLDLNRLKPRSLTVSAPDRFDYLGDRLYLLRLAQHYFTKIQHRTIIPAIETFSLDQAADAHARIEARQAMGAVVLTPGG